MESGLLRRAGLSLGHWIIVALWGIEPAIKMISYLAMVLDFALKLS